MMNDWPNNNFENDWNNQIQKNKDWANEIQKNFGNDLKNQYNQAKETARNFGSDIDSNVENLEKTVINQDQIQKRNILLTNYIFHHQTGFPKQVNTTAI